LLIKERDSIQDLDASQFKNVITIVALNTDQITVSHCLSRYHESSKARRAEGKEFPKKICDGFGMSHAQS
jgi:hypothetical protein